MCQKIECSKCKAGFVRTSESPIKTCGLCGGELEIKGDAETVSADAIVPFRVNKAEFRKALFTWLSQGEFTPEDVLTSGKFDDVDGIFMPLYRFKGSFQGSWTASSGFKHTEKYIEKNSDGEPVEKTREVIRWNSSNGQAFGDFDAPVFAGKGPGVSDRQEYARAGLDNAAPFDPASLAGFNILPFTASDDQAWKSGGQLEAEFAARREAEKQVPGDTHKDLKVQMKYELHSTERIYVPFWIIEYSYKGETHKVTISGQDATEVSGTKPEDKASQAAAKKLYKPVYIAAGAGLGVALLGWAIALTLAIILLVLGAGVAGLFYWKAVKAKKAMISDLRDRRQKHLESFLARELPGGVAMA